MTTLSRVVVTTTGGGSVVVPAGVYAVDIEAYGAGGSGATNTSANGPGGIGNRRPAKAATSPPRSTSAPIRGWLTACAS